MAKQQPNDDAKLKSIRTAQDRKDFAIAFYNATNNAIEMIKVQTATSTEDAQNKIIEWREWFLEQHLEYRAKVTEKIGANYDVVTSIQRLEQAKDVNELADIWISLTEDERRDEVINKKCQELKEKYETIS